MGADREGSKNGGGYTGGFFQLFDWTAKSRKKLFSSKTDLPERTKQRKKVDGLFPQTQFHLMDHEEAGAASSVKGSSDYSCTSSVTDDEGYGNKAPGVVARLMGLDSLPTSNLSEAYTSPLFDSLSLRDARDHRKNFNYYDDYQMMYSGNLLDKAEAPARNPVDPKPQRIISRPIEKFQTEILPPKSAKSIPVTHHKLLSPIKSPGFIPSKNAAHIMEAAARMIEPGPLASTKTRFSLVGSSSVPFKVQAPKERAEGPQKRPQVVSSSLTSKAKDLKEKVEVAQKSSRLAEASRRPVESNAARQLKGQSMNKSWDGSPDVSFRVSPDSGEDYCGPRNNGKSISLAIQAKVNVQRRESLNSIGNRISSGHKEQSEAKLSQPFKSPPSTQKNFHKKPSAHSTSGVLRQNNQKQNFLVDREKLPSKPSVLNSEGRKMLTRDLSTGHQKIPGRASENSRTGVTKSSLEVTDPEKEYFYSSTKNVPRKKRSIDRDYHFDKKQVVDNGLAEKNMHIHSDEQPLKHKNRMPVHTNTVIERTHSWVENSTKKSTDVVSFTFTAPLARPVPGSEITGRDAQKVSGHCTDNKGKRAWLDSDSMKFSSVGYNVIGADSLSVFLEQKLQELTGGFDFSHDDSTKDGAASTSASSLQDLSPTLDLVNSVLTLNGKRNQHVLVNEKLMGHCGSEFLSTDYPMFRFAPRFQGVFEVDECSSSKNNDARQWLNPRHPSPVSVLEPSFSVESCDSSVNIGSYSTEGSKLCSSVQAQEVVGSSSSKLHSVEGETELSDSASSISSGGPTRSHASSTLSSTEWELDYVKEILSYVEFTSKDFTLGWAIISPHLFEQLEGRKGPKISSGSDESKLRRKVLFDCVGECMDLRCRQYMNGGYKMWEKVVAMLRRKELLAEELYKEITGWKEMGDCMVDELVDKDMSSKYGRWLDFDVDAFELGVEFEGQMLNSLVGEIVVDMLRFY